VLTHTLLCVGPKTTASEIVALVSGVELENVLNLRRGMVLPRPDVRRRPTIALKTIHQQAKIGPKIRSCEMGVAALPQTASQCAKVVVR